MSQISILDCTLRDGGYINDWNFGADAISYILDKLERSGIEFIEVGFIKDVEYSRDRTVFPNIEKISEVIRGKSRTPKYVGMIDMSAPVSLDCLPARSKDDIDAIRVIFKQDRIDEGYEYAKELIKRGYMVMIQLVSTNTYTDDELIGVLHKFNEISPYALYIVDSLGVIKRKDFTRMVYIADNNLDKKIVLGYHSHNNLQQAMGNAEAFVEFDLDRDILIDACVFGMGRGAGNLNMELFCDYLNDNYRKQYMIEPLLEIIDRHLNDIYKKNFWGYSLPFYLSALNGCHPNYAKYYNEKGTLTEKAFNELLKTISVEDKAVYSKIKAEQYYVEYMKNYVDDSEVLDLLSNECCGNTVLILGPGNTVEDNPDVVTKCVKLESPIIISVNTDSKIVNADYIFCSNLRKYVSLKHTSARIITTSNIKGVNKDCLILNYASYISNNSFVVDNAGLMIIKIMKSVGAKKILLAGLDGYGESTPDYDKINSAMCDELQAIGKNTNIIFITKSKYEM